MAQPVEIRDYSEPRGMRIHRYAVIALNLAIVAVVSAGFLLTESQDLQQAQIIAGFHLPAAHLAESATHDLAHLEIEFRGDTPPRPGSESGHVSPYGHDVLERSAQDHLNTLSETRRSLADLQRKFNIPRYADVAGLVDQAFAAFFDAVRAPTAEPPDPAVLDALVVLELRLEQLERLNLAAAERLLAEDNPFYDLGERALLLLFVVLVVSVSLVTAAIVRRLEVESGERTKAVARMRRASGRLAETTDRLERAQRIARIGSWEWSEATNQEWWSDETYRLVGIEPQAAPPAKENYYELIHPADRALVGGVTGEAEENKTGYRVSFRVVLPDGSERVLREIGEPIVNDEGVFVGQRGTVQDITEQFFAEQKLREAAQRLEAAVRLARLGTWEWDLDNDTLMLSGETAKIWGLGRAAMEIPRHQVKPMMHPDDRAHAKSLMLELLETGNPYTNEYHIIRQDGGVRTVTEHAEQFTDDIAGKTWVHGTVHDMTERKRIEQELESLNKELEQRVEERTAELRKAQAELVRTERLATLGQLTATVSHELRNPLGAMRASMYVVERSIDGCGGERAAGAVERVNRNITRCDRIIDELLDYTRIRQLETRPLAIDSWLEEVLDEQPVPDGVQVRRKFDIPGILVPADADRLRRAVINVYDNACQALTKQWDDSRPKTRKQITIETRIRNDRLEIVIGDNGPGIPEDLLEKIFEPLFSTKNFGVGLGLPTVRQIMQQHHGGVTVSFERSGGAKFALWLPLEAAMESANS
jgi:PAS domain S-box-containing protein